MSERSFREPQRRGFDDEVFVPRRPRAFGAPTPRRQLPSGPPLRATVKWFSPEKGFGFVVLGDGSGDAFLHAGVVEQSGHDPADLPAGATLLVRIEIGQKGPQISEVLEVDKSTPTAAVCVAAFICRPFWLPLLCRPLAALTALQSVAARGQEDR